MTFLRSLLFQIVFLINFILHGVSAPMALLLPRRFAWAIASSWTLASIWVWKVTSGSTYEFRGVENLPEGGFIAASKHQSAWETLGYTPILPNFAFIMKRELMFIPIFGWFAAKCGMIPIDRGAKSKVIGPMTEAARAAVNDGRQIVIFMEGTRVPAGKKLPYKIGVGRLYEALACPVVPIALNTGLFWPRNSFWRYPGHVVIEILPPIMPGLSVNDMMARLEEDVERATNALILETARSDNPPPTIDAALAAMKERGINVEVA